MVYELNEEPPVKPVHDNVLIIPQKMVTEYHQGKVILPEFHTEGKWNHLAYGLVVDWGDHIPPSQENNHRKDYDKSKEALESLDSIVEPCKSVVGFSQKRSLPLTGYQTDNTFHLVKMANCLLAIDYDDGVFEDKSKSDGKTAKIQTGEFLETV